MLICLRAIIVHLRPESYNTVCPRPETCDTQRGLWCLSLQTFVVMRQELRSIHLPRRIEAETPILWPPDARSWLVWKDPDAGKDGWQQEEETTEDEMAGWHHRLGGHGFGWTLGVSDGQGGPECCGSWGRKELDTTDGLNWAELNMVTAYLKSDRGALWSRKREWSRWC